MSFIAGEIPVTLERYADGQYVDGYFEAGDKTEETVYVSVRTADPEEIERLVEGEQDSEGITIESRFELHTSESEEGEVSDFIRLDQPDGEEERYKILSVRPPYYNRDTKYVAHAVKE